MPWIRKTTEEKQALIQADESIAPAEDEEVTKLEQQTAYIDELSAVVSLVALVVLLADKSAMLFVFHTWNMFLPTSREDGVVGHMKDFKTEMEGSCTVNKLEITMLAVEHVDQPNKTWVAMPMGFETTAIYPSFMLLWVLACSAGFQTYRASSVFRKWREECMRSNPSPHHSPTYGVRDMRGNVVGYSAVLRTVVHLYMWYRVLDLKTVHIHNASKIVFLLMLQLVTSGPLWFFHRYTPNSPDFGRWVEYVITSPLQIVIVVCSVWSRDRAVLYGLAMAQANMMLIGYIIECCLKKLYKYNAALETPNTSSQSVPRKARNTQYRLLFALVLAWTSFGVIWGVIIQQFNRQNANAGKCDDCGSLSVATCPSDRCEVKDAACQGKNEIPPAVVFIVASQCLLFASFGLVQTWQILFAQHVSTRVEAHVTWRKVTLYYSILSVVAKCTLEIGFIIMLQQMPTSSRVS